jgi:hypothetical protein
VRRSLALALLVVASVAVPASASRPATCRHQLVDPSGDVDTTTNPSAVVPTSEVDLVSADLRTTRTEVIATIGLLDLPNESTELVDYSYSLDFSTDGERYLLTFEGAKPNNDAWAWHVVAGSDHPEQGQGGAQAAEGVGAATSFRVDRARNTVTLRFARGLFDGFGGIGRTMTDISASAWWGNGVKPTPGSGFAGTYGSSDFGYTSFSYTDGKASCAG